MQGVCLEAKVREFVSLREGGLRDGREVVGGNGWELVSLVGEVMGGR